LSLIAPGHHVVSRSGKFQAQRSGRAGRSNSTCAGSQDSFDAENTAQSVFELWHMAHGTWHMAHGTWHMAHGTWHMAHGTWHMAHGRWHMADGKRGNFELGIGFEIEGRRGN
jgi:hypothetical protein